MVGNSVLMRMLMLCLMALALGVIMPASDAYALQYNTPDGPINCDVSDQSMVVKVVYCVKVAVVNNTELFLEQTTELAMQFIYPVMLLVLLLLGVKVAAGEPEVQKMTLSFLLRFGIAMMMIDNFGDLVDGVEDNKGLTNDVFLITEQLQASAIPILYVSSDTCDINSTSAPENDYIIQITYTPWEYLDCVLDYIFGFGAEATIASSLFGFIGSTFFSGTIGAMLFMTGLATVLSLAMFAFRTVYTVLISYVYMGFLIVISPLIIPLFMFRVTESGFFVWLFSLVAGMVQPFMMVTYMAFAMPILDSFIFADDETSLVSTLGKGEEITDKYRLAEPICEVKAPSDFDFFDGMDRGKIIESVLNPTESGAFDWCGMLDFTKVDMGEEHIQELLKVFMSLLKILVAVWLITGVAKLIPSLTAYLVGRGAALGSAINEEMLFESPMRRGFRTLHSTLSPRR